MGYAARRDLHVIMCPARRAGTLGPYRFASLRRGPPSRDPAANREHAMRDTAETATPQPLPPGATRSCRPRPQGPVGLVLAVSLLAMLAQACNPEPGLERSEEGAGVVRQDDGDTAGQDAPSAEAGEQATGEVADWDEVRQDLGVSPADFRQRWNEAVTALEAGEPLGEPSQAPSGFRDLPTRAYPVGIITTAEVVLTPQKDRVLTVTADNISPVGTEQRRDLVAIVDAAVSAVTGLSPAEARQRVEADVGLSKDTVVEDHHGQTAKIEGVTLGVYAAHGTWEFFLQKKPE